MSTSKDELKQELAYLVSQVNELMALTVDIKKHGEFVRAYQAWYTPAIRLVSRLASDRLVEFKSYYEIGSMKQPFNFSQYMIQHYVHGVGVIETSDSVSHNQYSDWDFFNTLKYRLAGQKAILESLSSRIDGVLANIEQVLVADVQDAELRTARQLMKTSVRAAGALAGVVLEGHLQRVATSHSVKIGKKEPTIGDLNDPLRQAGVYDTTPWRKIQHLGDIRNLCSHRKDREPKEDEVLEMIDGVSWAIKTIS